MADFYSPNASCFWCGCDFRFVAGDNRMCDDGRKLCFECELKGVEF